jgi:hypothetical protein
MLHVPQNKNGVEMELKIMMKPVIEMIKTILTGEMDVVENVNRHTIQEYVDQNIINRNIT